MNRLTGWQDVKRNKTLLLVLLTCFSQTRSVEQSGLLEFK